MLAFVWVSIEQTLLIISNFLMMTLEVLNIYYQFAENTLTHVIEDALDCKASTLMHNYYC